MIRLEDTRKRGPERCLRHEPDVYLAVLWSFPLVRYLPDKYVASRVCLEATMRSRRMLVPAETTTQQAVVLPTTTDCHLLILPTSRR